jgi:hypothetical protein
MNSFFIHVRPSLGLVLVFVLFGVTGCGTLFHGTRQEIQIASQPSGASVFVNNQSFGETPAVVKLKRNSKYSVILEMPGYQPYEVSLSRKTSILFFVNIPVLGQVVDALSGAMYELTPAQIQKQFGEAAPAPADSITPPAVADSTKTGALLDMSGDTFYVLVTMEPDPNWKKIGQLTPINKTK